MPKFKVSVECHTPGRDEIHCLKLEADDEGDPQHIAEEIREIKSYKVQRTRDRIELETGSICKKVVDDKAAAQAQDLADYCKQQTECEPGGCIFATTGEGCILSDYVRPELWPDAIAKQQQEGQKNG